ncbi:MAG: sensor histidine kinase, partial [Microcystaceae cyanobacterium]
MFQAIRYRLLFSYLTVLTVILGVFAIAVRIPFAHSLREELAERLAILAQTESGELDLEGEQLAVDGKDVLLNANQAVQWFDTQGHLLAHKGNDSLTLPLNPNQTFQTQTLPYPAQGVTLPIRAEESNGELIG